ncbi:MAG: 2,3-bisphosphoglycerate-independent phosphoglycerate mutase [Thermoplasmata archaeon]|nr:2,3-bisphosphoglycerate-independent phosphoglycerate mutase [Thermoplasmata archaeon]
MGDIPKADKLLLMILDGWGHSVEKEHNAIYQANTPRFDSFIQNYPYTLIEASGPYVGLPEGQMGNSEVGHLSLGAGRRVDQPLVKISRSVENGSILDNREIIRGMEECKLRGGALHLLGLFSKGGVHSHLNHLYGLLRMSLTQGVERIRVHAITDGRDVSPTSSKGDMRELMEWLSENDRKGRVRVATIMGRYWSMDRDNRWDRTRAAFEYYVTAGENQDRDPVKAIEKAYEKGETDEFISPIQMVDGRGGPTGLISDEDTILFFNFRPDRARQMTRAFIYPYFNGFVRTKVVRPYYVAMTDYDGSIFTHVAYPEENVTETLGEVISQSGLSQLRIAETEKYAHVTFFLSGGREEEFKGEHRVLVPSPQVATYDLAPEMSAGEVGDRAIDEILNQRFDMGVLNFANSDMVGHTGILDAAVKAVESVDLNMGRVVDAALGQGYFVLVTADHGNSEKMWDPITNGPFTAHTTNPVPLIAIGDDIKNGVKFAQGDKSLTDIAPTILSLLGLSKPGHMAGRSLL